MRASKLLLIGASVVALGGAQSVQAQTDGASQSADSDEAIVVTGSRIKRSEYDSLQPITALNTEAIAQRGLQNVGDAVNELPGVGSGVAPFGNQTGSTVGQYYINLFGLGSQRTLTLVNGRRFVSGNVPTTGGEAGTQVDLNSIPTAFIERIEKVAVGGAPIYGSDAIAGTLNIILKRDFEGIDLDAQMGVSERGDGRKYRLRGAIGTNFADGRGNIALSGEYSRQNGLVFTDRGYLAQEDFFATNPANRTGTDGIPSTILIRDRTIPVVTDGGFPLRTATAAFGAANQITIPDPANPLRRLQVRFAPDGTLVPYNLGDAPFVTTVTSGGLSYSTIPVSGNLTAVNGGDGYREPSDRQLITGSKRLLLNAIGSYELGSDIRIFGEAFYSRTQAREDVNQPVFNSGVFPAPNAAIAFSVDNPFLSQQARDIFAANGVSQFFLNRTLNDVNGDATTTSRIETYRGVAGVEGKLDIGGGRWSWDASYNWGRTDVHTQSPGILKGAFDLAVDAVRDPTGKIVCRAQLTAGVTGCVPLNLFGEDAASPEARRYVSALFGTDARIDQRVAAINVTGPVFALPAGTIEVALGYEHRVERARYVPDDNSRLGLGRSTPVVPVAGSYNTDEVFGEITIPLISDTMNVPLVHALEAEGAVRWVENSLAGGDLTWTAGGRYAPVRGISFRGNFTRSIRAPAITELFLPRAQISNVAQDPCDGTLITSGPNPAVREANCRAAFVAAGLPANTNLASIIRTASQPGTTGGNPGLRNEKADSWTIGVVARPEFLPRFSLSADWIDIRLKDAITNFNFTQTMEACYDSASFPNEFCDRITRNSDFQVTRVESTFLNGQSLNFAGLQVNADYDVPIGGSGRLKLSGNFFYIDKNELQLTPTAPARDRAGQIGFSKYSVQANIGYETQGLHLLWQTRYLSGATYDNTFTVESRDILRLKRYFISNASASIDVNKTFSLRLAVNNVFDRKPPFPQVGTLGVYFNTYDFMGRYFTFGARARF